MDTLLLFIGKVVILIPLLVLSYDGIIKGNITVQTSPSSRGSIAHPLIFFTIIGPAARALGAALLLLAVLLSVLFWIPQVLLHNDTYFLVYLGLLGAIILFALAVIIYTLLHNLIKERGSRVTEVRRPPKK